MTVLRSPTSVDTAELVLPQPVLLQTDLHQTGAGRAGWRLAALALAMLLPSLGTSIANVALPTLAAEFSAPIRQVQWVVIAYLLAVTTLVVTTGRLGDLYGRRRLLLGGIAVFALASACCGLAPNLWLLVAGRAMQGAGAALVMALTVAMVSDAVPPQQTGRAVGLLGTVSAVGTALGPSLGGALLAGFGWPALFVVMAGAGGISLLVGYRLFPRDPAGPQTRPALDLAGMAVLAVALGAYALGLTWGGLAGAVLLAVAAAGLVAFVRVERAATAPMVRLDLLRQPAFGVRLLTIGLATAIVMATLIVGPFHLSAVLALTPAEVGLVMSVGPGIAALAGVPAGRLADRFGGSRTSAVGLVAMLVGSAAMALLPVATGVAGYIAALGLITAGYALVQAATTSVVLQSAEPGQRGMVAGLLALARNLGLITGASAMGALYAIGARHAGTAGDAGLLLTFGAATVLAAVALALAGAPLALETDLPEARPRPPRSGAATRGAGQPSMSAGNPAQVQPQCSQPTGQDQNGDELAHALPVGRASLPRANRARHRRGRVRPRSRR